MRPTFVGRTLASTVGSALEYYDFALYGLASALIFSKVVLQQLLDPGTALVASFATFGVGFVARPLGGLFFGTIGDKLGRKWVLVVTILLMGGSSTLVGALPTFATIGIWAPIQRSGDVDHLVVVEIEARHRVARLRLARLLLDGHGAALRVELHHAVALGIGHRVCEHGRAAACRVAARCSDAREVVAVEDVVAEDEAAGAARHEVAPDDERLREALGPRLHRVRDRKPPVAAVAQELA